MAETENKTVVKEDTFTKEQLVNSNNFITDVKRRRV